jgi:peptidyl-prolyl cis-trans isomerase D
MDNALPGLPNARNIVRWAYERRTRVGSVAQEIFEFENRYVIAALRQISNEGYPTLAEIQELPEVQFAVRNERKAEILLERMNNALSTNRSMAALEGINASIENTDFVAFTGYNVGVRGFEPELIGTIFGTGENRLSQPIRGRSGVFVAQPLSITATTAPLENIEFMREELQFTFERGMVERLRNAKERNARIVENRAFYF